MENLRAVVLRDFSYTERAGEEELASERFLSAAPSHVNLSIQPPKFKLEEEFIRSADVLISFGLKMYPIEVLDWVLEHPRHVHVEQDWWEPTQPNAEYRDRIIDNAALAVFMSPMHMERYIRLYNLSPKAAVCSVYPLEEDDLEKITSDDVSEAVLWYAPWHPDYGNDLMLNWARKNQQMVHITGLEVPNEKLAPLVEGIGKRPLDSASDLFALYSRMIYFPRKPIPFGLESFLAYVHGLEITYSGEIGWKSWNESTLLPLGLRATELFWNSVEEVAA